MSVSAIVVRGYGSWSDINKLPTLGYALGAALVPIFPGLATLADSGLEQATLSGTGLKQSTLAGTGLRQTTMTHRTS